MHLLSSIWFREGSNDVIGDGATLIRMIINIGFKEEEDGVGKMTGLYSIKGL